MRILYILHQFFPIWYTGTERFVLDLAKQMQNMGHYVEVLTYETEEIINPSIHGDGMYHKYIFENVPVTALKHIRIPKDLTFNIFNIGLDEILNKIITKERFDIVHFAHPLRLGQAIRVANSKDIPVVLTLTDFWLICPKVIAVTGNGELCQNPDEGMKCITECYGDSWQNKLLRRFNETNDFLNKVDCIVSPTFFLKYIYLKNYPKLDIKLIRFGVDNSGVLPNLRSFSENSELTLGFLSTLQPHKGAHVLLEAFDMACMDNMRIQIYGHYFNEIDYYTMLRNRFANEKIEFCGKYEYEKLPEILNKLDMVVVPSIWWENSPLVLLMALAHKVPAIVSDLGGMTEVIKDGQNGFTFKAGNAESLAEVLQKVGNNPTYLNEIKNGIQYPSRTEEEAFEYENLYLHLVNRGRRADGKDI